MSRLAAVLACAGLLGCGTSSGGGSKEAPKDKPPAPATMPIDAARAAGPVTLAPAAQIPPAPTGLPETPSPAHNPTTPEKVALGRLLFFDGRLSKQGGMSCASCHDPDKGWGDDRALAKNAHMRENLRHAPSLLNVGYAPELYWDGRATTLEACIQANWLGQLAAAPKTVVARLADSRVYAAHFRRAFHAPPSAPRIVEALSSFVRTIRSGNSPWDRHEAGEEGAVGEDAIAGSRIFSGEAQCGLCHPPPLYTNHLYYALGGAGSANDPDPGRYVVTKADRDRRAFKTPTVRGSMLHGPWLHDGRAPTIDAVLAFHLEGDEDGGSIRLSAQQKAQLVAFLKALSGAPAAFARPKIPPSP